MSATAKAPQSTLSIDDLRTMNFTELEEIYRAAKRPAALSDLNGDALGAMLAWRSPASGPIASLLRSFGESSLFPWRGKTFESQANERGEGINRIDFKFMKTQWFRFGTRFDASFLDGQPSFVLDYSRPGNPPLIRSIVDEVREVAPGLYLGPAALKVKGRPRPILFFSVYFPQKS
ncbi:MAG TPA: hypothetical protein VLL54_15350 [Pyrinomonadaceae bacterium]|nr:hypothetical protein [Pyrinomonadaceae bacterium]